MDQGNRPDYTSDDFVPNVDTLRGTSTPIRTSPLSSLRAHFPPSLFSSAPQTQRPLPSNGNRKKRNRKRKAPASSPSSPPLQQPPPQPPFQLPLPPAIQPQQPAQGQPQQVQAGLFPKSYLKDDFGKSIVYPQLLEAVLPEIVWPDLGRIFKIEHKLYAEVDQFSKGVTCKSKFFNYKYHNAELLIDKANITPEVFVWADVYNGKGEGNRNMMHFFDHVQKKKGCPNKHYALKKLMGPGKTGVIVSLHNPFSSEWLALCYEGGQIELLRNQLCNRALGEFPGIEHVIGRNMYRPGEKGAKRFRRRKFLFTNDEMKMWGIYTLARSFHAFLQQNHFIVNGINLCDVVIGLNYQIENEDNDNDSVFSLKNKLTPNRQGFSDSLNVLIGETVDNNEMFDKIWNTAFQLKIPQQCFVFIVFDGKKVPVPRYQKIAADPTYSAIRDYDDVLRNNFGLEQYTGAIVGIGYDNKMNDLYEYLKDEGPASDPLQAKIQELLKSEYGMFIQVVFSIASEDDTKLKKAVMIGAIKTDLIKTEDVNEAILLTKNVISNQADFETYGASCWFRAHQHFLAEPPSRLSRRHFTATRLKWD